MSFNLSRHAFTLLQNAGESIQPLGAAYQRLVGGCLVAVLLLAIVALHRKTRRAPQPPDAGCVVFPKSPFSAHVWVGLNALFGPVLGVSCMLWAISLVENPGLVQSVAATSTLFTVPFARRLEAARPRAAYLIGCLLALGGIAGLLLA